MLNWHLTREVFDAGPGAGELPSGIDGEARDAAMLAWLHRTSAQVTGAFLASKPRLSKRGRETIERFQRTSSRAADVFGREALRRPYGPSTKTQKEVGALVKEYYRLLATIRSVSEGAPWP